MRRRVAAGAIAAILGFAACGGSDEDSDTGAVTDTTAVSDDTGSSDDSATVTTGSEPAKDVDACGLLSEDEVSAIIGIDVITVPEPGVSGGAVCQWERPGDGYYTVRLTVGPANLYETLRSNAATDLDGLGDDAWSALVGEIDIGVRVGPYHVLVFFDPEDMSDADALDRGTQLTQAIVEALNA